MPCVEVASRSFLFNRQMKLPGTSNKLTNDIQITNGCSLTWRKTRIATSYFPTRVCPYQMPLAAFRPTNQQTHASLPPLSILSQGKIGRLSHRRPIRSSALLSGTIPALEIWGGRMPCHAISCQSIPIAIERHADPTNPLLLLPTGTWITFSHRYSSTRG